MKVTKQPEKMTQKTKKIQVINGPNLNMLGKREPQIYGSLSLAQINTDLVQKALPLGVELDFFQSNHEGEIVEKIQGAGDYDYLVVNAAAYTHTSVAIRDALLALGKPFIEVHMTNIYAREPFRHHSYLSDVALGQVVGFGVWSYFLALDALAYIEEGEGGPGGD